MPITTNRGYSTPVHGGAVDSWDTDLDTVFAQIDQNLGAVATVPVSNADVFLNAAQVACGTIRFTGTLTANLAVLFPAVSGWWVIDNRTVSGAFYIVISVIGFPGQIITAPPGEAFDILADGTNIKYRNLGRVGSYLDLAVATVPPWITICTVPPYLLCDGSSFNAGTYPSLAGLLGGTTLPDTRGRARFSWNAGTGRISTAGSGIDGDTRFSAGGGQDVTLNTSMIPAHSHGIAQNPHTHGLHVGTTGTLQAGSDALGGSSPAGNGGASTLDAANADITIQNTGGGLAHNNMPPAYIGGITMIRAA